MQKVKKLWTTLAAATVFSFALICIMTTSLRIPRWVQQRLSTSVCVRERPRLYDGPLNVSTVLSSYPRSGNTWLRGLIEKSTGFLTSSMYCDHKLRETFAAECKKSNRWLVKAHYPVNAVKRFPDPQVLWRRFDRVLHVVRNPFDAILSYHHYHRTHNHTEKLTKLGLSMEKLTWYVKKYRDHWVYWSNVPLPSLLVRYEDLKRDTFQQISRVHTFLLSPDLGDMLDSVYEPDFAKIQCTVKDMTRAYQSGTSDAGILYSLKDFDSQHIEYIVSQLSDLICRLGYDREYNRNIENTALPLIDCHAETHQTIISFDSSLTVNNASSS